MNSAQDVSQIVFQAIDTASQSDDLKTLLRSHLSHTCGKHLKDFESSKDKYKRYLVQWLAQRMVERVIRQFPDELAIELNALNGPNEGEKPKQVKT